MQLLYLSLGHTSDSPIIWRIDWGVRRIDWKIFSSLVSSSIAFVSVKQPRTTLIKSGKASFTFGKSLL